MQNFNPYTPSYTSPPQTSTYAFVNGIEGAKAFQVLPNQSMFLMDTTAPIAYMKTTNAMGQFSLRCFKLVEFNPEEVKPQESKYASKEDLDALNSKLDKLIAGMTPKKEA